MRVPVVVSWSGGKDSALALHALRADAGVEVVGLLTTVTAEYDRISMHGVRRVLLERQARELDLPLHVVEIGAGAGNASYEEGMGATLGRLRAGGVQAIAFGDLFLGDVRRYRERMMEGTGMRTLFPLWGRDTAGLAREFVALGFRAVLTCVDTSQLDGGFAGREFADDLLAELPPGVDPCGENGEFHTFVYAGPIFRRPIGFVRGEQVLREQRFRYCDLLEG